MSEVSRPPVWKRAWFQRVCFVSAGVLFVYGMIYWDVVSRAKEAYLEGEKYLHWDAAPDEKKAHFEKVFEAEKKELNALLMKNKIDEQEFRLKLDTLEFDRDFRIRESSLKYAYQWFKDTYELFSPPESSWVKKARVKAPETLELWKQELREKNIPFEDIMFE